MHFGAFYIDPVYLVVLFITLIISIGAQVFVSSAYRKWSAVQNGVRMTGAQVGQVIIQRTSLGDTGGSAPTIETPEIKKLRHLREQEIIM